MAKKTKATPECPVGHSGVVALWGNIKTKNGTTQRYLCKSPDGSQHTFSVRSVSTDPAAVIRNAIPVPPCPIHQVDGLEGYTVRAGRTYKTRVQERQRYRCINNETKQEHTFSTPLPRVVVDDQTECPDCHIPTPYNAGSEAIARRNVYPISSVIKGLRWLAEGQSYASVGVKVLEGLNRPVGRTRRRFDDDGEEIQNGPVGPRRNAKAHWHIAADLMEVFGPVATQMGRQAVLDDLARYRQEQSPVIYIADDMEVWRQGSRNRKVGPVLRWNALVVVRKAWAADDDDSFTNRLTNLRALPRRDLGAWKVTLSELPKPDYLVADGSGPIRKACQELWGDDVVFVPCLYHLKENLAARLQQPKRKLPEKITDHISTINRKNITHIYDPFLFEPDTSPEDFVGWFFTELENLVDAVDLPKTSFWEVEEIYRPQLEVARQVATSHHGIPLSNSGAEAVISNLVKKLTGARGPLFTNLARTNMLCELMVAGHNGVFDREHELGHTIQEANRAAFGWAPPSRILTEPAGTQGLQDPDVIRRLLQRESPEQ